jgi:hypothetical protein
MKKSFRIFSMMFVSAMLASACTPRPTTGPQDPATPQAGEAEAIGQAGAEGDVGIDHAAKDHSPDASGDLENPGQRTTPGHSIPGQPQASPTPAR